MKAITFISVIVSLVSGLVAAYFWYRASKIGITPGWIVESGELDVNTMTWVAACMTAFTESGNLNRRAALWTALAVASGTIANVIPFFATFA